ncbi:type I glutamate--ammonia ligase [Lachnoclostridium sp. An138]|uniref:type I glutamate--ammonia ligase n=1 Tax=Lachnoclostridium sp. An138 TaxID=1965560 RepID=UPI000B3AC8EB|nr:type I glutamate--ammonia ligase [Lachnoclostridium sp. An138]OUQ20819.1 type I glutamate--ammonia ligase [Lachnoclostridium sp. An138]
MSHYTKRDILRLVEEEDVEFIRLQFADLFGNLKNAAVTAGQLERVLDQGYVFDGSCVEGFLHDNDMDMFLWPDLDTLAIFPWRPQQGKVARLICDIRRPDGTIYSADPRGILKRAVKHAKEMEYQFDVGPECEFFLFHTNDEGNPTTFSHEQAGFFDMSPIDLGENTRRDIILTLEEMGFEVEASYHEVAPAQHQIDFRYGEALLTADNIMTFKLAVKTIAKRFGLHATFMPKPRSGLNGSSMHTNMSLSRNGKNIFQDAEDPNGLSREAYWFIGGLLKHARGMTAVTNPLVNSYKRIFPARTTAGYTAPSYVTWSAVNRSQLIRIPALRGDNTRIELRSPDPSCNPYLALAVCLEAGLDGIKNQIMPPAPVDRNARRMTEEERKASGIEPLPRNLEEALKAMEEDELVKNTLGENISSSYIQAKRREWEEYCAQVSEWEIEHYLHRF